MNEDRKNALALDIGRKRLLIGFLKAVDLAAFCAVGVAYTQKRHFLPTIIGAAATSIVSGYWEGRLTAELAHAEQTRSSGSI